MGYLREITGEHRPAADLPRVRPLDMAEVLYEEENRIPDRDLHDDPPPMSPAEYAEYRFRLEAGCYRSNADRQVFCSGFVAATPEDQVAMMARIINDLSAAYAVRERELRRSQQTQQHEE